jgi:hypothetical protein
VGRCHAPNRRRHPPLNALTGFAERTYSAPMMSERVRTIALVPVVLAGAVALVAAIALVLLAALYLLGRVLPAVAPGSEHGERSDVVTILAQR